MSNNTPMTIDLESPRKRPKIEQSNESDNEVEVLTPTRFKQPANKTNGSISRDGNGDDDDDIMITSSTTVNPNIDYVHLRPHCGVHAFLTNSIGSNSNAVCCDKCFCFVCDVKSGECGYWTDAKIHESRAAANASSSASDTNDCGKQLSNEDVEKLSSLGPHCNAHSDDASGGKWNDLKEFVKRKSNPQKEVATDTNANAHITSAAFNQYVGTHSAAIRDEVLARLASLSDNNNNMTSSERIRARKEMRITEVLLENFRNAVTLSGNAPNVTTTATNNDEDTKQQQEKQSTKQKTAGDIPSLAISQRLYIEGIHIGFPYTKIMKPQRQIMIHLIKALKSKKHVVIESPTGTGKSAAILCCVLAWMRWNAKEGNGKKLAADHGGDAGSSNNDGEQNGGEGRVRVIYCSRTHSQVAQMVTSLKSTPYRPSMAILGSRDRLCIHKSIKPRTPGAEPITGINVNNECRVRVRNTEKYRKHKLSNPSSDDPYLDEDPPDQLPGDGTADAMQDGPTEGDEDNNFVSRSRTCPHYRQLTANRVANLAHSTFVPNSKVDCCSIGGKKSKYGAHDIEDLVEFGKDPYVQNGVALYRGKCSDSYGLTLKGNGGCFVHSTKKGSPADISGEISNGDKVLRVNGSDVARSDATSVAKKIKESEGNVLLLDVSRGGSGTLSQGNGGYSSHSACPYYISHMLAKDADLVFAPYNYVLDPQIRNAMGIELRNSVVILDEGHNIEGTLREAGSGRFGEFELSDLLVMLNNYAVTEKNTFNTLDVEGEGDTMHLCDVAHALLLFVEKVATKLKESRLSFERNPGPKGAQAVLRDYEKFHHADDTEFEISLHGPTGNGVRGAAVGCLPFFERLGILQTDLEMMVRYVDAFEKFCRGQDSGEASGERERDRISNLTDRLIDLVHKMCSARTKSEHYYAATVACANGNLDFANGADTGDGGDDGARRWKKKPRAFPVVPPRTLQNPDRPPNPCLHALCKARSPNALNPIRHGQCCDGSTPKWEAVLNLELLTPGPLFQELTNECRTVILASGSLAPIPSLCAELNLFSTETRLPPPPAPTSTSTPIAAVQRRLQTLPRPLEADHVVDLDKQLFVTAIGHFADGSELQVSHKNYSKKEFLEKLGDSVVKVVEGIPSGGVLVFLPSYALLRKCERLWNPDGNRSSRLAFWSQFEDSSGPSVWERLKALKHNVIVEPSGSNQTEFEEKKQEYMDSVDRLGGCVLFAVYRGKMSEGISFNDDYARGVICIGVPLPNLYSLSVKLKMNYNDEQRKLRARNDLLPGREWYSQQAYRAIAQALGRCIRHSADYGAIFLMDSRHCDDGMPNDGTPNNHKNLPKWMRTAVRTLNMNSSARNSIFNSGSSSKIVSGGYAGLKKELIKFFRDAKPFVESVLLSETGCPAGLSHAATQQSQLTPPPGSLKAPLSISTSSSNSSVLQSVQHIQLPTASKSSTISNASDDVIVLDSLPPKKSEGVKVVSKQNSLMSAFQRQRENEPAAKPATSKTPKVVKRSSTPSNLKSMFEKQLSETSKDSVEKAKETAQSTGQNSHPNTQAMDIDSCTQEMGTVTSSEMLSTLNPTAHLFKRSPFAQYAHSPQESLLPASHQPVALASNSFLNQQHTTQGSSEADAHLCVICEDGKKQVVLLPCKHMCLCKACADFDKIKECPMCRTEIEDSMAVFI